MWQIRLFNNGVLKDKPILLTTQPIVDTGDFKRATAFW